MEETIESINSICESSMDEKTIDVDLNEAISQLTEGIQEDKVHNDWLGEPEPVSVKNRSKNEENIKNVNGKVLLDYLSPEITKNEEKKRAHKDKLIEVVKWFIVIQFGVIFLLVFGMFFMVFIFHIFDNDLEYNYFEALLNFITAYIGSVVIELIAMLNYIVKNVFDTSLAELVKIFREPDQQNKENEKK